MQMFLTRRKLWLLIYLLIVLILVLHRSGPQPYSIQLPAMPSSSSIASVDLQQLQIHSLADTPWPVRWLALPGSNHVTLALILSALPATAWPDTWADTVKLAYRGGYGIVQHSSVAENQAVQSSVEQLAHILPTAAVQGLAISGPVDATAVQQIVTLLHQRLMHSTAPSMPLALPPIPPALSQFTAPPVSTQDYLAFQMVILILSQRLAGYDTQPIWHYQQARPVASLSLTVDATTLRPIDADEFSALHQQLLASAQQSTRSLQQVERYLLNTLVYDLPPDYLRNQIQSLQQIDLAQVNRVLQTSIIDTLSSVFAPIQAPTTVTAPPK